MPAKYRCTSCSRSFVHKETLNEHKLLHGIVIFDDNKFSCPVCQCEITCESGSHQHGKSHPRTRAQVLEFYQTKANSDAATSNKTALENGLNTHRNSKAEGIKLRSRNKNAQISKTAETEIVDTSGSVSCKICRRSFVYQKCLQKHMSLVHGLSSEDGSYAEMKSDMENAVLSDQKESFGDHLLSEMNENHSGSSDEDVINDESCDGTDSLLVTSELVSKTPEQRVAVNIAEPAELTVSLSDLQCKTCMKQFKHKAMLLRHMHMSHAETDFERCTCPLCSEKFSSQWVFSRHFAVEHKTKAGEILAVLAGGQKHPGDGDDVDISWCDRCSQWFTCQRAFQKHCGLKHHGDLKRSHMSELNSRLVEIKCNDQDLAFHEDRKPDLDENSKPPTSDFPSDDNLQDISDDQLQQTSKYLCSICNKNFVSVNFLDRHIRIKHSSNTYESPVSGGKLGPKTRKQTFVCGFCSEEFDKEGVLAEHVESCHKGAHGDSAECACPLCGCTCPNQTMFSMHYDAAHCMNTTVNPASSASVVPESANNPVRRCTVCELWFTSEEVVKAHHCLKQTPVRQPPKTGRARYRCMQCGEAFEILRRFLHHRKMKHRVLGPPGRTDPQHVPVPSNDSPVDAPVVDTVNGLDTAASQHMRGRPPKSTDEAQVKKDGDTRDQNDLQRKQEQVLKVSSREGSGLSCPECRRMFATVSLLRRHRKTEHRNRTCQLCGETCKSADMVYYHNLKYHHEQKCEVCGASCSGRLGLIDHFRAQHPNEPPPLINRKTLICEYCPRVFAGCASRLLRDHIESCHLGRVHLCDVCGKRLGSAQTLAVHRRMHDPVARFECRDCNRRFPHNTNLMNHIRKHHPERLPAKYVRDFRCDVCSMQFGSSSGLSRHRSEKHGTQRFQCDMCLRVFPSVTGLRIHKRRDHQPKDTGPPSSMPPLAIAGTEAILSSPPPAVPQSQVVAQFTADPTNAIMAGFMANMIGLPSLGQNFQ